MVKKAAHAQAHMEEAERGRGWCERLSHGQDSRVWRHAARPPLAVRPARTLFDVGGVLGGGLQEWDAALVRKRLGLLKVHLALGLQVALVAYQQLVDILARVAVNLVEPLLDVVERLPVGDVINNDNAVRAAVVAGGDRAEALLPRSVPLRVRAAGWGVGRAGARMMPTRRGG